MVIIDRDDIVTEEERRLGEDREKTKYWKRWGPYVSERQWATGEPIRTEACRERERERGKSTD